MNWKTRLLGISLAGGSILACEAKVSQSAFPHDPLQEPDSGTSFCNANLDPCCSAPDSGACFAYHHDAGSDAAHDAAADATADAATE